MNVLLQVQYLGEKLFRHRCLKQILNQNLLKEPRVFGCSVGHFGIHVKLGLRIVFLVYSAIQQHILTKSIEAENLDGHCDTATTCTTLETDKNKIKK